MQFGSEFQNQTPPPEQPDSPLQNDETEPKEAADKKPEQPGEVLTVEEDNKEMDVEDDDEKNRPKPNIKSLQKNQPSFVQAAGSSSQQGKKEKLRTLFLRYAEVSSETGIPSIKPRQFVKLLQDAGLLENDSKLTKSRAEIIYSSQTKSKRGFMTFDTFLACLLKIAETAYPELIHEKKSKAVEQVISQHFLTLQDRLALQSVELHSASRGKNAAEVVATMSSIQYDNSVKELLVSLLPVLKDIYDVYFGNSFKVAKDYKQIAQLATKQLIAFLRDFDVTKNFVQKQSALVMLENLVHTPDDRLTNSKEVASVFGDLSQDYGCYFTLSRFFVFLLCIAVTGFDATKGDPQLYTPVGM